MDKKFDFNDISLIPATLSSIKSRNEINVLYNHSDDNRLPLFVSPMDTVVDENNYKTFLDIGFNVCIPRKNPKDAKNIIDNNCFISYGLSEINDIINNKEDLPPRVLIDVANGHSIAVYETALKLKDLYDIELMVGNIANPKTYELYSNINIDYIRVGIGAGQSCTTSANSSIHYPMASLISEISLIKKQNNFKTNIVADGGFRNYDDVIKALGLGADYVMLGSIINKSIESCGDNFILFEDNFVKINIEEAYHLFKEGKDIYKQFRGMSTKEVQKKWGKENPHTAEGIVKMNKVEYSIHGWVENFKDYLKSCMSYQGYRNIYDFIGNSQFVHITQNSYARFHK